MNKNYVNLLQEGKFLYTSLDMGNITLHDKTIPYTVIRGRRRTVSMTINAQGEIEVKSPWLTPDIFIEHFIQKHTTWILKRLENKKQSVDFEYKTGELFPFFGEQFPLVISESTAVKDPRLYFIKNSFQAVVPPQLTEKQKVSKLKKIFKHWYLTNTKDRLVERVDKWAKIMDETYNNLRIKDVSSHWGSCSRKRNLNFNYRIALLPSEAIDYIIVHELCHLKEMNHSNRFWALVEKRIPEHKKIRTELRKKSIHLD